MRQAESVIGVEELGFGWMIKVHPTFHVKFLKPFYGDALDESSSKSHRALPPVQEQFDKKVE
ncbi:hypothetical protein RJ641_021848 [Dillenia turbinata]|uniref:Uncharacterized protein n=1 Tax=Dillenia turbinata TaxID=194707 RepID=A0AAN8UQ51_9MAGN